MATKTRNELDLKEKFEVITYAKNNPGAGERKIASVFKCGKTQIQRILCNKEKIVAAYETNEPGERKRCRAATFTDVNEAVYKWYLLARQRNIPVSGPMLQEEACEIATRLDPSTTFKASNGWLDSFKKRHNIKQMTVSGECGDVRDETVSGWKERLKTLMIGYKPEDIWNTDETGCFYRALPEKTLSDKKKECRGGKKAKERLTVAFFVSATGEKIPAIVIGKAKTPRCFKGLRDKRNPHGLPYYSNKKAWMNTEIMNELIAKLNHQMRKENRNILLLLDNVSSHSPELVDSYSNVKVVFLPVNTTSKLQPLDAGIIKNFKVHYRRQLLKYTLSRIREGSSETASAISKSVSVLDAIRWIKQAWEDVSTKTITNCFHHCGAFPSQEDEDQGDPFADLDDTQDPDIANLNELVTRLNPEITAEQYLEDEEGLSTCDLFDGITDANWHEQLRSAAVDSTVAKRVELHEDSDSSGDEDDSEHSSITTIDTAMTLTRDLQLFLLEQGEENAAEYLQKVTSVLEDAKLRSNSVKQTVLEDFFTKD